MDKKKGESFMKELMIFEGHEVEVFEYEGQVLFNPYDVAECLDLADSSVRNYLARMNNKQMSKIRTSENSIMQGKSLLLRVVYIS